MESLAADNREVRDENQRGRDENKGLKGQQGQPDLKANVDNQSQERTDPSSKKERHQRKRPAPGSQPAEIIIDREEVAKVDPSRLAPEAEFKGSEEVGVQDRLLKTDQVRFRKEQSYWPARPQTYRADLPGRYPGPLGSNLQAWALRLYFGGQRSQPKIAEFRREAGIQISDGDVSKLLIKKPEIFQAEKEAVDEAGLPSTAYQPPDDPRTRVNGHNQPCQGLGNLFYPAYCTSAGQDRLRVLEGLRPGPQPEFLLKVEAWAYLKDLHLSQATGQILSDWRSETVMTEAVFLDGLEVGLPGLNPPQRNAILAAAAVSADQAEGGGSIGPTLVCDDPPQFKGLRRWWALGRVPEGRPYQKLTPSLKPG